VPEGKEANPRAQAIRTLEDPKPDLYG